MHMMKSKSPGQVEEGGEDPEPLTKRIFARDGVIPASRLLCSSGLFQPWAMVDGQTVHTLGWGGHTFPGSTSLGEQHEGRA